MKFNDNCLFKLYDLKKNSKFFDKDKCELSEDIYFEDDGKRIWVYEMEEGITELLELIYDRAFRKNWSSLEEDKCWVISIDFTDTSYKFKNPMDALEIFRNKSINDLESASIYYSCCGVYAYTDFEISHNEGIVKN